MKKNSIGRQLLFYAVVFVIIIVMLSTLMQNNTASTEIKSYDELYKYVTTDRVKEITLYDGNQLTVVIDKDEAGADIEPKTYTYTLDDADWFRNIFDPIILEKGDIVYNIYPPATLPWWVSFLPTILIIVLFVVIYFVSFKKMSGGGGKFNSFGKAKVKTANANDKSKVLFRDVAGADEEKEELVEIVEFLKDPAKFTRLGAKIPHGVLLMGPPGTGKTLLAKAVAGEAGVPFYSISGSDFVEMYVGVGASRVRDLFETARKTPAAIIFIDEIDAVGRHRGAGLGGGHDEREQTLNQLLVEMDGFGSHDGIIVMAATNRPDILDPALLRPGRFDRQVTVNYPDMKGREEILKVHARNKPLESGVDFHKVAQSTVGFTGADLANLLNEAALLAAKKGKSLIGMDDIEESYMKELLGPQKKTRVRRPEDNKLTAYHEAGHAVVSYYCEHTDPVKHITIIPAGRAGGVTVSVPVEDVSYKTRGSMLDDIRMSLGGRIAEELIMGDISTGASGDIQHATKVARDMITRYGMSDKMGTVLYGSEHTSSEVFLGRDYGTGKNYSEQTAAEIDGEIRDVIGSAYAYAKKILSEHIDKLHFVAQYLLKHESMDGDQFAAAMKDGATEEELDAIAAEKAEKSRRDNEERAAREAEEKARIEAEKKAREAGNSDADVTDADVSSAGTSDSELLQDAEDDDADDTDEE
ncbi:MAG: ATP-dependent zinc metalloprotease FtsH [Clostridia bacterium]|nr:ATP-dependent zinc metalloprotease FtsH [Clostridia bacterium]